MYNSNKFCSFELSFHHRILKNLIAKLCYNQWISLHGTINLLFTLRLHIVCCNERIRDLPALRTEQKHLWLAIALQKSIDMSVIAYDVQHYKNRVQTQTYFGICRKLPADYFRLVVCLFIY